MRGKWLCSAVVLATAAFVTPSLAEVKPAAQEGCIECHAREKVAVTAIEEYRQSAHAKQGVSCVDCHAAAPEEVDGFEHHGTRIATIVTPTDCAQCHEKESKQFQASHHAKAGQILGSLDNFLGEVIEGAPAAIAGCKQCHGGEVKILPNGRPDPATWPNTGIGRLNPDGSRGSCTACHSRHNFGAKVARSPESCGKCHLGPDHPQKEIYEESKHGIAFFANRDRMNLGSESWVLGKDYSAAPTCTTCHMGATPELPATHDPGERLSWTLRPAVSKKMENWESKRSAMESVCGNCHSKGFVGAFYKQYDVTVEHYNDRFAKPAGELMEKLYKAGKLTPTQFDEKIEWTYYLLWHHEGRRARHGAAMNAPDYTQWHGFFEVAQRFYLELLPEAEELLPGSTAFIIDSPEHAWRKGVSPEEREKIRTFYEGRYGK
ncbi:MAG: ammonia-forming cytochrome c nitrite reductase subunit c552 [Deltaproteobacteria bacterium]|nr:ammonia-forming cytochrome c nitrite reductase subunit c552 [Deltaproteobacteria bacterium]